MQNRQPIAPNGQPPLVSLPTSATAAPLVIEPAPVDSMDPPVTTPEPAAPRKRAPLVFAALAGIAVVGAATVLLLQRGHESTDDAFVEGHVANVAARLPGQVKHVLVTDNQAVKAGDVLVELDARDQQVRYEAAVADLDAARAQLASAEAQLALTERGAAAGLRQAQGGVTLAQSQESSSSAQVAQARADLDAAKSRRALAELEHTRTLRMQAGGASSVAELDGRKAALEQATAAVSQAEARLHAAEVGITGARGNRESANARFLQANTIDQQLAQATAQVALAKARARQAETALAQADLNRSYMVIRAPQSGVVSRRTVEVGQMVDPARPLLSIVSVDDSWVVANFKEDQIAAMKPNQKVELEVDAYPGKHFAGHVESLAGGTGSRFALLPPDNATGNFTKVVQRIPVLIRIEPGDRPAVLRPGMSVVATVTVK